MWAPEYEMDIGAHVFPTEKYRLVKDRLVSEGILNPDDLHRPTPVTSNDITRAHDREYVARVMDGRLSPMEERLLELPYSETLRDAFVLFCGGTLLAGRLALAREMAIHLGGGFHHAFADHGEGFCLFNDVAIAVRCLEHEGVIERSLVVDLDVHHGNGTAAIFEDVPEVFTFSMHQESNYPALKPPSDLDVGLADGVGDDRYLSVLDEHWPAILETHAPDIVFFLAGADPFREDQLGGLRLSFDGLRARDRRVLRACRQTGVPVVVLLAGGYALRREDTVEIHCNTVREAIASGG